MSTSTDQIARALLLACKYIEERDSSSTEDDDVQVLEEIAAALNGLTLEEKRVIARVAESMGMHDFLEKMGIN